MRFLVTVVGLGLASMALGQTVGNCTVFPANNIWNRKVNLLPVAANSSAYIKSQGGSVPLHPDFGTVWDGAPNGLQYVVVPSSQPKVNIVYTDYGDESDPGPFPVPPDAPIEGGPSGDGDRHVLVVQNGTCKLYELYGAYVQPDGSWEAASGAVFDLTKNGPLRPAGWTSADAAGLPIFPGLVRYDEVQAAIRRGDLLIGHAFRFTVPYTRKKYLWPARHYASSSNNPSFPAMGQRFRLKAKVNINTYPGTTTPVSKTNQVILRTLKTYGMIVADNGSSFFLSGAADSRWNDDDLHELTRYKSTDFEAVDESKLMVNINSGQAK